MWPPGVTGCAAMVERLVLPPGSDGDLPEDPVAARAYAREHPDRQEVRIVAGATRTGSTYCALRLRAHDEDTSVVGGVDLVPGPAGPAAGHPGRRRGLTGTRVTTALTRTMTSTTTSMMTSTMNRLLPSRMRRTP